ncbi:MAG: TaqI-like C-terminal specificity domain-containing protein, partial [Bacillota bacterium]|nr:TaqI-like C-terminal specificity domain-containing protein [Bacillota bacterium]
CSSYQGIITGCDKAFIVSRNIIEEYDIEGRILRPWIKSSSIKREGVEVRDELFLIYSNLIEDEEEYPNAIRFIGKFRERLEQRRECRSGKRKWYELQWGREPSIFEGRKIIFPYKCNRNTFAIDGGSYFSADVYSLVIKDNIYMDLDYEFLQLVLNSALYEFYFKCFAKKLGGRLFEYYPNNLNRLRIPLQRDFKIKNEDELYNYFELTTMQVDYVKKNRG